jgi:hypothetical protein
MLWLKSEDGYFWNTKITGFRVGTQEAQNSVFNRAKAFKLESFPTIFDTATSLIYVP